MEKLIGKKIAILVEKGFEQIEMTDPRRVLEEAGARTFLISPQEKEVTAWNSKEWGNTFKVEIPLADAHAKDFDALLLPGGVMSPDKLRMNNRAIRFVKEFFNEGKPVAAICHGPWTLINANVVKDKKMTSYPSLQKDLENAGARWVDKKVVVDNGLVTSRNPNDLPAFNKKMLEEFAEGKHSTKTNELKSEEK